MKAFVFCLLVAVTIALVSSVPLKGRSPFDAGACNDTQDLEAFNKTMTTFHGLLQSCATKCFGAVSCATTCIEQNIGLTEACATCFATDTHCTLVNCEKYCISDPTGPACLNCSQENCFPALLTCAGVNKTVIPQ